MKDESIRYLGLDVHRSTIVASVRDEQGKVMMKATIATEEKAIVAWSRAPVRGCTWPSKKGRKHSGCMICCSVTPSAWSCATYEDGTR